MKKGHTIHQFLHKCLENLRKDFSELRAVSVEGLMYIKEDLIIPHVSFSLSLCPFCLNPYHLPFTYTQHHSFYDFIINKARGKSGPLFSFDVHDDVRLIGDASVEKDEVV